MARSVPKYVPKSVVIVYFDPAEAANVRADMDPDEQSPFDGLDVLAIEAATPGSDYEDLIGPHRQETGGRCTYYIQEL